MTVVVRDTNVLVSAMRTPRGNEARVLALAKAGALVARVSAEVLDEYNDVLRRVKFDFASERIDDALKGFQQIFTVVTAVSGVPTSPDPSDNKFIACAMAAEADFLVTGNRRHFPAPRYGSAVVVNARELLAQLG